MKTEPVRITVGDEALEPAARTLARELGALFPEAEFPVAEDGPQAGPWQVLLALEPPADTPDAVRKAAETVRAAEADAYLAHAWEAEDGTRRLLVLGNRKRCVYFGVFHFLREAHGMYHGFHGDVRPDRPAACAPIPEELALTEVSRNAVRSYKPQVLGNYSDLHSPWAWDTERWMQCVDWCVRQRYNAVHVLLFAQMNFLRYDCAPEARGVPDPYMSTDERIRMLHAVIERCHEYGLEAWIGYCTNASTFEYQKHHPDHMTTSTSFYQGYLCWTKARDHLAAVARETVDTYADADAFTIWPHEGGCKCPDCADGRAYLSLVLEAYQYIRERYPDKAVYLLDWHFPTKDFLDRYGDEIPEDMTFLNVHMDRMLVDEVRHNKPVIHQACVANWDVSNATTISPNLPEMLDRARNFQPYVVGFEAHHVSMFSGEYTIDAFGDIAWDPDAFSEIAHRRRYTQAIYGQGEAAAVEEILELLSCAWRTPFHNYTGWPLCDGADDQLLSAERVGGMGYRYERQDGMVRLAGGPVDLRTGANMLQMAASTVREADMRAQALRGATERFRFLKASTALQRSYIEFLREKYAALLDLREAGERARDGHWPQARAAADHAAERYARASHAYDEALSIARGWPKYFHVIEGISRRGHNCQLSDYGLERWSGVTYVAVISPAGSKNVNLGRAGIERLIQEGRAAIGRGEAPDWQALAGAIKEQAAG